MRRFVPVLLIVKRDAITVMLLPIFVRGLDELEVVLSGLLLLVMIKVV